MEIKVYGKPVMTKFVVLNGEEFQLSEVYVSLEQIMNTKEDDFWGDYSLRDYQLYSQEVMDYLVDMGLVKNYPGPRMANLYCMKDEKGIEKLQEILYELDMLQDTPAADVREVVHAKWINAYPDIEPNPMLMYGICSNCGFKQSVSDSLKYCPECGAKMDL